MGECGSIPVKASALVSNAVRRQLWLAARAAWASILLSSGGAYAGETAAAGAASQTPDVLEEIVVTAQKRTERLQDVPISAQVIGSQALIEQNHTSLADLSQTLPGVHISSGSFSNNLFIRGIGSGAANPSYDQSVATFVDDIYFGRSRTSEAAFLDLDRIEVLKGPQSTFFGNNAIAGALNIVSKKPGDQFDAWGRLLYGQFGQYAAEGAVGGPLSDTFGVRLAVTRNGDDKGWIENVDLHEKVPRVNNLGGRATFAFEPGEDFDVILKVEGSEHRTGGAYFDHPSQYANCPPPAPIAPTFSGVCNQAIALGVPLGLNNDQVSGLPGQGNRLSTFENTLTLNYRQWDHTFTSVSGFYNYHFSAQGDAGLLPVFVYQTQEPTEKYHQFSQELRVASPADQLVEYLAGAYFQTDQLVENIDVNAPFANFVATLPGHAALAPYLPVAFEPGFAQHEKIYSIFGSLSWKITDSLKLNAGIRGSRDNKDFDGYLYYGTSKQLYGGFTPIPPDVASLWSILNGLPGTQSVDRSDQAWMPSAGLQYRIQPDLMAYFSYNRGFKAGGFNGLLPNRAPSDLAFGPEHVNAYELGFKSKWLDERVLVNFDVFRSNYQGLQANTQVFQPVSNTYAPLVRNAAASRSEGAEIEAQWLIVRDFRLAANVSYLHSYYASYPNASPTTLQGYCQKLTAAQFAGTPLCQLYPYPVPSILDLSGEPTPYSPRWSGSVVASYSVSLPGDYRFGAELMPYLTAGYQGSGGDTNDPLFHIAGYTRLDARLTFEKDGGRWAIDVIGKNLTDHVIATNPGSPFFYLASKEMPRNVAAQFRFHW